MSYSQLISLSYTLALIDIKKKYKRSLLGPLWITLSASMLIIIYSLVFDGVLSDNITPYVVYVSVGSVIWNLISGVLIESGEAIISNESIIKQMPLPCEVFILKILFKNILIFFHNILIIPVVFIWYGVPFNIGMLFLPISIFLICLNLYWMAFVVAIISVRYRDIPPLVINLVQFSFYLTPIIWTATLVTPNRKLLLNLNIFYHMVLSFRSCLINSVVPYASIWILACLGSVGLISVIFISKKYSKKIVYWV